eukprot:8974028-Heterocapsa_arctica.AAC.1
MPPPVPVGLVWMLRMELKISENGDIAQFNAFNGITELCTTTSGHVEIKLTEFPVGGWKPGARMAPQSAALAALHSAAGQS